jgi:hypothetical protein
MTTYCRASGCGARTATRFSIYCARHKARLRRHGAVDQRAITKAELKPYIALLQKRIAKNADNSVWHQLDDRWLALVQQAKGIVASGARGVPGRRFIATAANEIIRLSNSVEPRAVVETTLAMVIMHEFDPSRFRSDKAFKTQLVRRVRGLTEANVQRHFNYRTGKDQSVYSELPPKATAIMGQWIAVSLGPVGLHLVALERQEIEKTRIDRQNFKQALSELT